MKKCWTCKESKEESCFNKKWNWLQSYCKECNKNKLKEHYIANKEHYLAKRLVQKEEIVTITREAKNVPCTDCKQLYPYYVMDFDHLWDKSFDISRAWVNKWRLQVLEELKKCEPVCANCHRVRTYFRKNSNA